MLLLISLSIVPLLLWSCSCLINSVQFSHSVMSNSLQPHGLQHARLPCPSTTPGAYSNSCPSSLFHHLILSRPLLPPSIFPSIRVFSNESVICIRWPKFWSFSFSISLFNKFSGLISVMIDWLDLLAVQGTFKNLFQHHSQKHGGGGLVTQSCPTLCDPMDGNLQGSSLHGISQPRTLEWVAISFSRGSSQPRNQTQVSCIDRWILY